MIGHTEPMAMSENPSAPPTTAATPRPSAIRMGEVMSPVVTPPESQPMFTYFSSLVIAALGGVCGCCLLPCVSDGFKDSHHYCTQCNNFVGAFMR